MSSEILGGGSVLPPSSDDYKRMWEEQSKQLSSNEYNRQAEDNKRMARKQVFQEAVQKAVEVRDPRLSDLFHSSINLRDRK
jgi:hypothetical protein